MSFKPRSRLQQFIYNRIGNKHFDSLKSDLMCLTLLYKYDIEPLILKVSFWITTVLILPFYLLFLITLFFVGLIGLIKSND